MITHPFIGITGISTGNEVESLLQIRSSGLECHSHAINTGILISEDTFNGVPSTINRYPEVRTSYQIIEALSSAYTPVIHYNTGNTDTISRQVENIFLKENIYKDNICRMIQLNIGNPELVQIMKIKDKFPDLIIILQVPLWIEEYRNIDKLSEFLMKYTTFINHYILDPSGGRGTGITDDNIILFKDLHSKRIMTESFIFAGGLSGKNVYLYIKQLQEIFHHSNFSIDAEGKLRGGMYDGRKIGDRINPTKTADYLHEAIRGFSLI